MALTRAQLANPDCEVTDSDYEAIESAIMETARGRWFLFEYARRHRHADTMMVMTAINSLHDSLQGSLQNSLQTGARRNAAPYQVSTMVSAALLTDAKAGPAHQLRVTQPPTPQVSQDSPAEPAPLPANTDVFEFK